MHNRHFPFEGTKTVTRCPVFTQHYRGRTLVAL
jgi:hypothetical protein